MMDQQKLQQHVSPKTERLLSGHNWETFKNQAIEASKSEKAKTLSKECNQQGSSRRKDQAHGKKGTSEKRDLKSKKKTVAKQTDAQKMQEKQLQQQIQNGIAKHPHEANITKHVAMDCEMVGIGDGSENMIARVSIVNRYGYCFYDKYVKPTEQIKDYRSAISGIYPHHLKMGINFEIMQREVAAILKGRILIGHGLRHDLSVLYLSHPRTHIRDTSMYRPFRQVSKGKTPSLKKLALELLDREIQTGEHSSIEDARATMQLYMLYRSKWESTLHRKPK